MKINAIILFMILTQYVHSKEFNYCEIQAPQNYKSWGEEGTVFVGEGNYLTSIGRFLISDGIMEVADFVSPTSQLFHRVSEGDTTYSVYKEVILSSNSGWVVPTLIIFNKDSFVYIHNIKRSEVELMFSQCANININRFLEYYQRVFDFNINRNKNKKGR